jgi:hypothetical protein
LRPRDDDFKRLPVLVDHDFLMHSGHTGIVNAKIG